MRLPRRRGSHRFRRGTESEMLLDMRAIRFFSDPPGATLEGSSLLLAASREYRRAPDRHGGTLRISGPSHRQAVSPAPCKWDKRECREVPWKWACAPPSGMNIVGRRAIWHCIKGCVTRATDCRK